VVLGWSVNAGGGSNEGGSGRSLQRTPPLSPLSIPTDTPDHTEHAQLLAALKQAGGNKAKAARLIGVDRMSVYNHLRRYGIAG
jgi:transcriptional regulator of acetoin/glycerol metabolism